MIWQIHGLYDAYDVCNVYDVFTPSKPAKLTFVERDRVNDKIVDALRTPGKQLIVYGHTGSGKTTLLLNKLCQLYETQIITHCMDGVTFEQLIIDAFDQLNPYFTEEQTTATKRSISSTVKSEYLTINGSFSGVRSNEHQAKQKRTLPPQLTVQRLARFLGEAGCPWVLEDFHKIQDSERRKLAQAMKIFVDIANLNSEAKIIAIGAVDTARQVVAYEPEMRSRVAEVYVPLMDNNEIEKIITKGTKLLNIEIKPDEVLRDIVTYSNGLAAVAHQLCLNSCVSAGIDVTYDTNLAPLTIGNNILDIALTRYYEDESDTVKSTFNKALFYPNKRKYDHYRLILNAISSSESHNGLTRGQILESIKESEPDYSSSYLTSHLKQLCSPDRCKILKYENDSGLYSFKNPFHNTFARVLFSNSNSNTWEKLLKDASGFEFSRLNKGLVE